MVVRDILLCAAQFQQWLLRAFYAAPAGVNIHRKRFTFGLHGDQMCGTVHVFPRFESLETRQLLACDLVPDVVDDHCNDADHATRVSVPSATAGRIEGGPDQDLFSFPAVAGTNYVIETTTEILDTTLTLFGQDGKTQLAFDDDFGTDLASRIRWTAPLGGEYFVQVRSFRNGTGTYDLHITGDPPPPVPTLVLSVADAELSEDGGTTVATLTRLNNTRGDITVDLHNDSSEFHVPDTVFMVDGTESVEFTVTGSQDNVVDGTRIVTLAATAPDMVTGFSTFFVVDTTADDHANSAAQATFISVPSSHAAHIEQSGDVDWFRFPASKGITYFINTELGTQYDTTVSIFSESGELLASNDDSGEALGSRFLWTAETSGEIYLVVRPHSVETGSYTLNISGDPLPPAETLTVSVQDSEIGETASTAGTVVRSTLRGDVTITLHADKTEVSVPESLLIPNGSSSIGFPVKGVQDNVVDGPQLVRIVATAPYRDSVGATLHVLDQTEDDHGDTHATATPVESGTWTDGKIDLPHDADWYRFTAEAGKSYTLQTQLDTLSDSTMELYDGNGTKLLAANDDFMGIGLASKIIWTAPETGIYHLLVSAFRGGTGTYKMSVS